MKTKLMFTTASFISIFLLVFTTGCADNEDLSNLNAGKNLVLDNGTVTCKKNPDSTNNVQYEIGFNITNKGKRPVTFDHLIFSFGNYTNIRETNLSQHKFNKTTIEAGRSERVVCLTGEDSDGILNASKNGDMALKVTLHKNTDGLILKQMAPLPGIIPNNGHTAELPVGAEEELEFIRAE
ncbi:MAG: hypothetical protein WC180_02830 [Candidatus Paceibacterota bacterium]